VTPLPRIEDLCSRHSNEDIHTEHVAALAVQLFDATHAVLRIPSWERRLLEAACRLHDIGYMSDPANHATRSAEIVMKSGIDGFSAAQTEIVACAILMHRKGEGAATQHPYIESCRNLTRAMRLAAYLRVADGLDHGHIQDGALASIRRHGATFRVLLRSDGYWGNAAWAQGKADLWHTIFPIKIWINSAARPAEAVPFQAVVLKHDSALEAARKVFYLEFRIMTESANALLKGSHLEYLHDVRVALNRFRAALSLFRPLLPKDSFTELNRAMVNFRTQLGPARDAQVWVAFMEELVARERLTFEPACQTYVAAEKEQEQRLLTLTGLPLIMKKAHIIQ